MELKSLLREVKQIVEGKSSDYDLFKALGLKPPKSGKDASGFSMQSFMGTAGGEKLPSSGSKGYKPFGAASGAGGGKPAYIEPKKWISAGGVVLAGPDPVGMSRVWIRKSRENPGYPSQWSFAKGRVDGGESKSSAALREVEEEMGLHASMLASGYLGMFAGGYSITHYYLMVAKGSPGRHDKETEKVALVSWDKAIALLGSSDNSRDVSVAKTALAHIRKQYEIDALHGTWVDEEEERR